MGVLIEAGWYSESFFDLLRMPHLLSKVYPIGINLIQPIHMLAFNVCRWNPYKRLTKNLQLSHRCIGLNTVDILEFRHARQNIAHNVHIFIKSIQAYGPTCVLRR